MGLSTNHKIRRKTLANVVLGTYNDEFGYVFDEAVRNASILNYTKSKP